MFFLRRTLFFSSAFPVHLCFITPQGLGDTEASMNPTHQSSASWKQKEILTYFTSRSSLHLTGHFCSMQNKTIPWYFILKQMRRTSKLPNPSTSTNTYPYYWHFSVSRGLKAIAIKISINCQVNSYYLANYLLCWVLHYQANISCKCQPIFSDTRSLNAEQPPITKF